MRYLFRIAYSHFLYILTLMSEMIYRSLLGEIPLACKIASPLTKTKTSTGMACKERKVMAAASTVPSATPERELSAKFFNKECAGKISGRHCQKEAKQVLKVKFLRLVGQFCEDCSERLLKNTLAEVIEEEKEDARLDSGLEDSSQAAAPTIKLRSVSSGDDVYVG
jgi:hypothetical protein